MTDTPLNFTPESFIKYHYDKGTLRRQYKNKEERLIGITCPQEDTAWGYVDRLVLGDLFGDAFMNECDRLVIELAAYLHNHPLGEEIKGHVRVGESHHHNGCDYIIVSRGPSDDCGCPEELLDINGWGVVCHFEADGTGEVHFFLEDGTIEKTYNVKTMEELRHAAIETMQSWPSDG